MKNYSLMFLILLFFVECDRNAQRCGFVVNDIATKHTNRVIMLSFSTHDYTLDKETINLTDYITYLDTDTANLLSLLNSHNNSIYFYNYDTKQYVCKLPIDNKKIGKIQGYEYINNDSIFVYSYSKGDLFAINSASQILKRYKIAVRSKQEDAKIFPYTYLQTPTPIKKIDNRIVTIGFVSGETNIENEHNRPVCSLLELESNKVNYIINYPKQYTDYNWGGGFEYRMPYFCTNDANVIISFPAHHYLIKYSVETGEQNSYYAGSKKITSIQSFPEPKRNNIDGTSVWNWYISNPSYEGVFYDKYRELYYRIARLPDKNYKDGDQGNNKPVIIIVLDSELNYIGEVLLPKDLKFMPLNCFVSKNGLNVQVLTDDEDKLTFYEYKFDIDEKN